MLPSNCFAVIKRADATRLVTTASRQWLAVGAGALLQRAAGCVGALVGTRTAGQRTALMGDLCHVVPGPFCLFLYDRTYRWQWAYTPHCGKRLA